MYMNAVPIEGDIRVVGPETTDREGILEIYTKHYGWSTICTSQWDDKDASVACQQLGFHNGGKHYSSRCVQTIVHGGLIHPLQIVIVDLHVEHIIIYLQQ